MSKQNFYDAFGIGRRKCSVARVYLKRGTGKFSVNKKDFEHYFERPTGRAIARQPLELLKIAGDYDILVNVQGGGITGQAGAVRLGISRALEKINGSFRKELKPAGFLTRDSRKVERKKYGFAGSRRSFQFSKR